MEANKVDKFLLAHESKFPDYEIPIHHLLDLSPEKEAVLAKTRFKHPVDMLLFSFFLGHFGVDRFMLGDKVKGIIKLLTFGGLSVWFLIDLFLIMGETKRRNLKKLEEIVKKEI